MGIWGLTQISTLPGMYSVLQGLTEGFQIGVTGGVAIQSSCRNHTSSMENSGVGLSYIESECSAGHFLGPLPPSSLVHVSPIGLVPKSSQPGSWRMIVDLSHSLCSSGNDASPPSLCSPQYLSVDDAVTVILALDHHTQLVKIDQKNAYRVLPTHPLSRHLLGVSWGIRHLWTFAFCLGSTLNIFTAFADVVVWAIQSAGVPFLLCYLEDFRIVVHPGSDEVCQCCSMAL